MILPTKHIPVSQSFLGTGASVLRHMDRPLTLTRLWERVRLSGSVSSYERFLLTLDLLYAIDAIELADGLLRSKGR